jgi:hypothetical protein
MGGIRDYSHCDFSPYLGNGLWSLIIISLPKHSIIPTF